jgi:hypothetical protein
MTGLHAIKNYFKMKIFLLIKTRIHSTEAAAQEK